MSRSAIQLLAISFLISNSAFAALEDSPMMGNLEAPGAVDVEVRQEPLNEFVITESGGGLSGTMNSEGSTVGLALSGEYHRTLNSIFQVGAAVGYSSSEDEFGSDVSRTNALTVSALGTLNFGSSAVSSFFLRGQAGRSFVASSRLGRTNDSDRSLFEARLGKRFEITPQVSFAPHVYVGSFIGATNTSLFYGLRLLSASVHW